MARQYPRSISSRTIKSMMFFGPNATFEIRFQTANFSLVLCELHHCISRNWPGKARELSIYIMPGFSDYQKLLKRLGQHHVGKSCLYVKSLDALDAELLQEMFGSSVATMRAHTP